MTLSDEPANNSRVTIRRPDGLVQTIWRDDNTGDNDNRWFHSPGFGGLPWADAVGNSEVLDIETP